MRGGWGVLTIVALILAGAPTSGAQEPMTASATNWAFGDATLTGPIALKFLMTASSATTCQFEAAVATINATSGTRGLFHVQQGGATLVLANGVGGSTVRAQAVSGTVDSDSALQRGAQWAAAWRGSFTTQPGAFAVAVLVRDAGSWNNALTNGDAIKVRLDCDAPITQTGLEGSRQVLLLDTETRTLLGARATVVGATVSGTQARTFSTPQVEAVVGWFGLQVGQVVLQTPTSSLSYSFIDESGRAHHSAGGGSWAMRVDYHASTLLAGYAGGIAGYAPLADISAL